MGILGVYVPAIGFIVGLASTPFVFVRQTVLPNVVPYVTWGIFTQPQLWNYKFFLSMCSTVLGVVNTAALWTSAKYQQKQMYTFIASATIALIVSLVWFAVGYCAKENNDFNIIMQFWTITVSYIEHQSGHLRYDSKHDQLKLIYAFGANILLLVTYLYDPVYVKVATKEKKGNGEVVPANILAAAFVDGRLAPVDATFVMEISGFRENPNAPVSLNGGVYPSAELCGRLCYSRDKFYLHFRENSIAFWVIGIMESYYYIYGIDPAKWAFMPLCVLIMNTNNCREIFSTFMSVFDAPGWFTLAPSIYTHLLQSLAAIVILMIGACSIANICHEVFFFAREKILGSTFKNVNPTNHRSFTMKMVSWAHDPTLYGLSLCLYTYLYHAQCAFLVVLAVSLKCTFYRQNHFVTVWNGKDGDDNHFQIVSNKEMNMQLSPKDFCGVYASAQTEAPTQDEVVRQNRFHEAGMIFLRVFPAAWGGFCNLCSVVSRTMGKVR